MDVLSVTGGLLERKRLDRRVQLGCLLLSTALHALLLLGLPAPREWHQPWEASHIGFEGPELLIGEINPQDHPIDEQEALASARAGSGALLEQAVVLPTDEENRAAIMRTLRRGDAGKGEASAPVMELGEDWALRSTSEPSNRSSQFVILTMVRPEYPTGAVQDGIEGLVRVQASINTEGRVVGVTILESEVDAACDEETKRAMGLWRFKPYRIGSVAVPFSVVVPFRFRLM
jgi:TonB family protein